MDNQLPGRRPWPTLALWAVAGVLGAGGATAIGVGLAQPGPPPAPPANLPQLPPVQATTATQPATTSTTAPPVKVHRLAAKGPAKKAQPATTTTVRSSPAPLALASSVPVGLNIPAIGVDTQIVPLGLNPNGTVQVPPLNSVGTHEAGWYDRGATPGTVGAAVILGHVDSYMGAAVFYRLGDLRPGNLVDVDLADRQVAVFRVDAVASYPKSGFPTGLVYGPVGYAGLRLVTCGGTFDYATGSYLSNTIVSASLVGPKA